MLSEEARRGIHRAAEARGRRKVSPPTKESFDVLPGVGPCLFCSYEKAYRIKYTGETTASKPVLHVCAVCLFSFQSATLARGDVLSEEAKEAYAEFKAQLEKKKLRGQIGQG